MSGKGNVGSPLQGVSSCKMKTKGTLTKQGASLPNQDNQEDGAISSFSGSSISNSDINRCNLKFLEDQWDFVSGKI